MGREVAVMPLLGQPEVIGHGAALEGITHAADDTVGADYVTFNSCQVGNPGLPLMVPAASMDAAWAAQSDPLMVSMSKISRQLAQILVGCHML